MIIIGISAKKQGGKSTLVDYLMKKIPGCSIVRFADSLKQVILDCFIPPEFNLNKTEDLDTEEVKNITLPCGKTIRELLQIVGTDWFRHTWEECWINCYKKKIHKLYSYSSRKKPSVILTPDVRFPNELEAIQKMGGKVIRLLRAPFLEDQHESETALDKTEKLTRLNYQGRTEKQSTIYLEPNEPGKRFDMIYDNREKTLEDTQEWVVSDFIRCFDWKYDHEGETNMSFDLRRLIECKSP